MNKGNNIGIEVGNPTYMPEWNYALITNVVGFSSFLQRELWYNVVGKTVYFVIRIVGGSNSGNFRFTLPNNLPIELYDANPNIILASGINNSSRILSVRADFANSAGTANSFTVTCYPTPAGLLWGSAQSKGINLTGFFETN